MASHLNFINLSTHVEIWSLHGAADITSLQYEALFIVIYCITLTLVTVTKLCFKMKKEMLEGNRTRPGRRRAGALFEFSESGVLRHAASHGEHRKYACCWYVLRSREFPVWVYQNRDTGPVQYLITVKLYIKNWILANTGSAFGSKWLDQNDWIMKSRKPKQTSHVIIYTMKHR